MSSQTNTDPAPAVEPSPWLTVREAARRVKCDRRLIYAAVAAGRLRASRLTDTRELRIRVAWVDAWVESRSTEINPGAGPDVPRAGWPAPH